MFSTDITQNYTQQDATLEILIMLAGAFILGCLLCWLIRKLKGLDKKQHHRSSSSRNGSHVESHYSREHHTIDPDNTSEKPHSLAQEVRQNEARLSVHRTMPADYSTPKIDDLTKISGIDTEIETDLRERGIKSYLDLRDSDKQSIIDTLEAVNDKNVTTKEAQTWPHQASLAAKGEWEKLHEYQLFMQRTKKAANNIKQQTETNDQAGKERFSVTSSNDLNQSDDLKKIEGIGPKIEEVLNQNSIKTFKDLRKSNRDTLKSHLNSAGNRFKMHEPESWPHQAGMAERGEWEELKIYQEFMDGGREIPSHSASAKIDTSIQPEIDEVESDYNVELTKDDLKKIEGIGPKIEQILNAQGITTFAALHEKDRDTLKGYLDEAGNQFKMHEPESWPHQAGMAATGQWEELAIYQDFMDGGREIPSGSASLSTPTTSEGYQTKSVNEFDDLKKIEGIGPKIQELLNKNAIKTYKDLSITKTSKIKDLLDSAGPQYRMHDPETWPKQAKMAFENEWDKLEKYQDEIITNRMK